MVDVSNIENKAGIYLIANSINRNVYIGQSAYMSNRLKWHIRELKNGRHGNRKLQRFVNKYGLDILTFSVLEYCERDKIILCDREQHYIDQYPTKFNIAKSAYSTLGVKKSAEERRRMSLTRKGRKQTPEQISNAAIGRTGVKHSFRTEEHKEKIRQAALKRNMATFKGKKHNPKTIEKLREIASSRPPASDEFRKKMSEVSTGEKNGMHGKKHSEATREKLRQKRLEYYRTKKLNAL